MSQRGTPEWMNILFDYLLLTDRYGWCHLTSENLKFVRWGGGGGGLSTSQTSRLFDSDEDFE